MVLVRSSVYGSFSTSLSLGASQVKICSVSSEPPTWTVGFSLFVEFSPFQQSSSSFVFPTHPTVHWTEERTTQCLPRRVLPWGRQLFSGNKEISQLVDYIIVLFAPTRRRHPVRELPSFLFFYTEGKYFACLSPGFSRPTVRDKIRVKSDLCFNFFTKA